MLDSKRSLCYILIRKLVVSFWVPVMVCKWGLNTSSLSFGQQTGLIAKLPQKKMLNKEVLPTNIKWGNWNDCTWNGQDFCGWPTLRTFALLVACMCGFLIATSYIAVKPTQLVSSIKSSNQSRDLLSNRSDGGLHLTLTCVPSQSYLNK